MSSFDVVTNTFSWDSGFSAPTPPVNSGVPHYRAQGMSRHKKLIYIGMLALIFVRRFYA